MSKRLLSSLILLANAIVINGCLPSGICGANPYCGGGGMGFLPQIPPIGMSQPLGMGGCGPGLARGPYGCYQQRRAHASSIYKPEKRSNYTSYKFVFN